MRDNVSFVLRARLHLPMSEGDLIFVPTHVVLCIISMTKQKFSFILHKLHSIFSMLLDLRLSMYEIHPTCRLTRVRLSIYVTCFQFTGTSLREFSRVFMTSLKSGEMMMTLHPTLVSSDFWSASSELYSSSALVKYE